MPNDNPASQSALLGRDSLARAKIVGSAIDILVKGALGTAIQNMNVMFGLPDNGRARSSRAFS